MRAIFLAAATVVALSGVASAQTTIIERDEPAVVVRDRPAAVIERREVGRDLPPAAGCESKTVTRTDDDGETTTVRKERCD
ncbi:hypothetical protein [Methylobacterium brachythecii]|nr:hypothetical protein [Methylobacterium brachythecii]